MYNMKVAFEPKHGYFLGQIYTTKAAKVDVFEENKIQLPKHLQKARKLGDNKLFIIRVTNEFNTYKVGDIVHVELDPKDLTPMSLDTTEGIQEFYFIPEDFIIGKKVNIKDTEDKFNTLIKNNLDDNSKLGFIGGKGNLNGVMLG